MAHIDPSGAYSHLDRERLVEDASLEDAFPKNHGSDPLGRVVPLSDLRMGVNTYIYFLGRIFKMLFIHLPSKFE